MSRHQAARPLAGAFHTPRTWLDKRGEGRSSLPDPAYGRGREMKRFAIWVIVGAMTATAAYCEDLVEIRHIALKDRGSYPLVYWCIEKDQVPSRYVDNTEFIIVDRPMDIRDSGVLIATQPDYDIFLTSEACLEETIAAYTAFGGSADDLVLARIPSD